MELVIVTGLSGAGKSRAADALEDIGFFCVDNMPPELIPTFVDLILKSQKKRERVALVVDARLGTAFSTLFDVLQRMQEDKIRYKILFIDADDAVIERRYHETRRKHPLSDQFDSPSVLQAIQTEREMLLPARQKADYIIDTTGESSSQFKERIANLFLEDANSALKINCMSFGFKYGSPKEADLLFDVRCLPNPFYVPNLKEHTGLETPIKDYVMQFNEAQTLLQKLSDLLDFLLPLYRKEGKSQLTIAIGCTGGKHRSVVFAEMLNQHLHKNGAYSKVYHRDIQR